MTPNPTLGYRKRGPLSQLHLSFSFFPSSFFDIRGVESFCVQLLDGEAEENLPLLLGEGGTDRLKQAVTTLISRIASGTVCVKAEEKGEGRYIQQREGGEREGGRWNEAALKAQA